MKPIKVGITLDETIWEEFKALAKKNGMPASLLCQLLLGAAIESDKRGMSEIAKNMMIGVVKGSRDIKKKEKDKLIKSIMDTEK